MLRTKALLALALSLPALGARAQDVINNGGGLAEQNFAYVWMLLPRLLDSCERLPSCYDARYDTETLRNVREHLSLLGSNGLRFASESKNPGFFPGGRDGVPSTLKLAIDGNDRVLYVNLDAIYERHADGTFEPMSPADVMLALGDVLAMPVRSWPPPDVIDVGLVDNLVALLSRGSEAFDLRTWKRPGFRLFHWKAISGFSSSFHVDDGETLTSFDLTTTACKAFDGAWSDKAFSLSNVHWQGEPAWSAREQWMRFDLVANVAFECADAAGKSRRLLGQLRLSLAAAVVDENKTPVNDASQAWRESEKLFLRFVPAGLMASAYDLREAP
jgi:hypothetical protein